MEVKVLTNVIHTPPDYGPFDWSKERHPASQFVRTEETKAGELLEECNRHRHRLRSILRFECLDCDYDFEVELLLVE